MRHETARRAVNERPSDPMLGHPDLRRTGMKLENRFMVYSRTVGWFCGVSEEERLPAFSQDRASAAKMPRSVAEGFCATLGVGFPDNVRVVEDRHDVLADAPESARPHMLAGAFWSVLREWLTSDQRDEMIRRNRRERDPGVCHSHDFCDANMAMLEAYCRLSGKDQESVDLDEALGLFNAAWDAAGPMLGKVWRDHR